MICAPDIFSWTFGFVFLNFCQVLYDLYRIRPVRLDPELETVFSYLFQPLGVLKFANCLYCRDRFSISFPFLDQSDEIQKTCQSRIC